MASSKPDFSVINKGYIASLVHFLYFCEKRKLMKRIILLLIATMACFAAYAQAHATYKEKVHDFGYIKEAKGQVSHTFELTNTGNKPLVILQVITSCGCTRPSFPTKPIKPGKTAKIKITFNPAGRSGAFMKPIKVTTSGNEGKTTLTIRGTIIPKKK